MFDGQIAPTPTPHSATQPQKDQALAKSTTTPRVVGPAEIEMLDLSPSFCDSCGAPVKRFVTACTKCRAIEDEAESASERAYNASVERERASYEPEGGAR